MQISQKNSRFSSHPLALAGLVSGLLLMAACQPIQDPALLAAQQTAVASGTSVPAAAGTPEAAPAGGVEAAKATIATSSLRVRELPSDDAEVVAAANEGDVFSVVGISSDGAWIQVEIEEGPDGLGWISAEFVTLAGDITSIQVVEVETVEATAEATEEATAEATEEATEEATAEATPEATEEATPEPTEEATAEPTAEATEEATPEATEEATPEPTAEATEEATPEATEEATAEPTAEATEEATPEATEEATPEATEESTPEATEEATPEATEEATEEAASELGTVTIVAVPPLRVRSEPTAEVENKIGNVFDGEVYTVLEISEDGAWVRIETPQFPEGSGWVSAEFVIFNEAE
jgi:uncharacterized protein YgiM (DUF1202 family)